MKALYLIVPFAPLLGAIIAGFLGWLIGRRATHRVTILCMIVSFAASCLVLLDVLKGNTFNGPLYTWITSGGASFHIGFLIDPLSALMMVVVTFVSLAVHVYTIGYMHDDPGYQRFFSYISLFTFSMLMLVMANNFLQLFFGWEAVGLISYLLIGFWYTRPTAIFANLKAFLVNRVGDFGFLLGIALVLGVHGQPGVRRGLQGRPRARRARPSRSSRAPLVVDDGDLHPAVHRCDGQVGAVPAARVAARLDGRPHAHLRADPRRDHGDGGHLHGRAHVAAVRAVSHGAVGGADHRGHHRLLHGAGGDRDERHQTRRGLLDAVPARLHDGRPGRLGLRGRHVPPDDPRVLQGAAVPGGGLGDHRHASRAGHAQDGRPAQVHADHLLDGA